MKRLPDSELEVMLIIWKAKKPVLRPEIEVALKEKNWAITTLNSFLSRLIEKGFLSCRKEGKWNVYTALVKEEDYLEYENNSFVEKLYGNSLKSFVASVCQSMKMEDRDIQELQEFLETLKRGR